MDTLIDDLIALRKRTNLTQSAVAEACGVDQTAVSHWEKRKTKPSGSARILLEQFIAAQKAVAA